MRIAAYMRYSTDNQELKVQKNEIDKFISSLKEVSSIKEYIDEGMSGRTLNRRKFEEMRNDILAQKIDTVIALKLDRLSRTVQDLIEVFNFFNEQNIKVMLVKENVDTSSAQGRFFFIMLSAFAEFEREVIRERLQEGKKYAKIHGTRSGKPMHRPKTEFNLREAKKLREMGLSYNKIAKQLGVKSGVTIMNRLKGI